MMKSSKSKPAISLDFKKDRIRIYKRTLHSIGDPEYIQLLINPENHTLAIWRSNRFDLRAYRLPRIKVGDKQSFEITSKYLMKSLLGMCNIWQDNKLYRVYGEIIQNDGIIQFNLMKAVIVCETRK